MSKNHFINAFRNFQRNTVFLLINAVGLTLGITATLVIYLVVHFEFSFDKFEKDNDRIFRVVTDIVSSGSLITAPAVPSALGGAIRKEVSDVENLAAIQIPQGGLKVEIPKQEASAAILQKHQSDIVFADDQYLSLLSYKWLAGSPQSALTEPFQVILTLDRARSYFPGRNPAEVIGQKIIYNDSVVSSVAGIVENISDNTDFHFKEIISLATIPATGWKKEYSWASWNGFSLGSQVFLKTTQHKNAVAAIEGDLRAVLKKYIPKANRDSNNTMVFRLQPLDQLHFDTVYGNLSDHTANKPTLYGLLTIATILLLLGCINFINLSTAHSVRRAKEIGIRKTLGCSSLQIAWRFLGETAVLTFLSTIVAVLLTPLFLRLFSDYLPKGLSFDLFHQPDLFLFLLGLATLVAFLAGSYPALVLSKYNPAFVLKNQLSPLGAGTNSARLRKSLTIAQFFLAQVLLIITLVTIKQIYFISDQDLGIRKEAILLFDVPFHFEGLNQSDPGRLTLLNELKTIPGIQQVSLGNQPPASADFPSIGIKYQEDRKEAEADVLQLNGDTGYIRLYGIKILAGRVPYPSDTQREYLVNETYMHILGYQHPEAVLGKKILGLPVVGVMKDFHQQSLHSIIKPMMFTVSTNGAYTYQLTFDRAAAIGQARTRDRTMAANWTATIEKIRKAYKKIYPDDDFEYSFFDDQVAKFYADDERISVLLKWATGLAVFISCMGLLGLVIYTMQVRIKEIGVRKVLGASVSQIALKLSTDFVRLILYAFVFAIPLAYLLAHAWLQNFAFRTHLSWWVFLASAGFMILVALMTLSIQVIRAARANPVQSLRVN